MISKKILILINLFTALNIYSQDSQILEFNDKPIVDILLVLGDLTNRNLIIDKTVLGNTSYYFKTDELDDAFEIFLISNDLYIEKIKNAFYISKIEILIKENSISLKCNDTNISDILKKLSSKTEKTILYDELPIMELSLNIGNISLQSILEIILKRLPGYTLENNSNHFYIKKNESNENIIIKDSDDSIILNDNGTFSVDLEKVRFTQVISELFDKANIEYSLQGRNDNIINSLKYKDKRFDELLNLILENGSCDYVISNQIYYIFDISKSEIQNRHIETEIIKLNNITIPELLKILPGPFISNNILKTDERTNSVIVYGSKIKIEPLINFIKLIDIDKFLIPRWIKMNFTTSELFKTVLVKYYPQSSIINVDETSFIILLNDIDYAKLLELKNTIDVPLKSHSITLKYIKSDDLVQNLPNTFNSDSIIKTEDPTRFFYYGEDEAYENFMKYVNKIDRATTQIKYKILVLQNTLGDNKALSFDMKAHSKDNGAIALPNEDWNAYSGNLGKLLDLNFNVLSAFGALFSFELNASIQENKTKVLVDTTLQGLSGHKVSFRNTTTSRFYQTTTDVDGEVENGAAQEVSWGIILNIEGWSSGDGMVTVNVESTISDETTVSGESSGIPSTSEKIVNTEIRTKVGTPVVIGGLLSSKKEKSYEKTPILGDIPLLNILFKKEVEYETQSEFIIYLTPFIETNETINIDSELNRIYEELL